MGLKAILKAISCKLNVCCKSKCSLNDTNNDGIIDELEWETAKGEEIIKKSFNAL